MKIKYQFLKLISYILPIPIKIKNSISFYDTDTDIKNNMKRKSTDSYNYTKKYELKENLGSFVLVNLIVKNDTEFYKIKHIDSGTEIIISKKTLDLLFNNGNFKNNIEAMPQVKNVTS